MMDKEKLRLVVELRHELHKNAELSGKEEITQNILKNFIKSNTSFRIVDKKSYFYAVYKNKENIPNIAIRADIDAVPIDENIKTGYCSINKGVSHKCGHDGHSSILVMLALLIEENKLYDKNIYLLFQPAEEIGQGAKQIVEDNFLKENNIDEIYSFHNIPNYKKESILIKEEVFACASKGMIIKLKGKPSHAAYPEFGTNPSIAAADIIKFISEVPKIGDYKGMVLSTLINVSIGEKAFGTSAGYGEIMTTIRAENEDDLNKIENKIKEFTKIVSKENKLQYSISFCDEFPETRNNKYCVDKIRQVAINNNVETDEIDSAFRWSEDFGYYLKDVKGCMFGIGSGLNQPQLHTLEYDFPDDIIYSSAKFLYSIL
jgi:amidohydrolase